MYKAYSELSDDAFTGDTSQSFADLLAAGAKEAPSEVKKVSHTLSLSLSRLLILPSTSSKLANGKVLRARPPVQMVCDFIPEFFARFPEHADAAVSRQIDLCDDEDDAVRVKAVKVGFGVVTLSLTTSTTTYTYREMFLTVFTCCSTHATGHAGTCRRHCRWRLAHRLHAWSALGLSCC